MKTIITTVLLTLAVVVLTAAATTRIYVGQILGSQTVGQVITTTSPGVSGWANLPTTAVVPNFSDAEIPQGTVNGTNPTFTLVHADTTTGQSLVLSRNGVIQQANGNDYTLAGATITFTTGSIPQPGDILQSWYRY